MMPVVVVDRSAAGVGEIGGDGGGEEEGSEGEEGGEEGDEVDHCCLGFEGFVVKRM